ncbi:hypothetical protein AN958_04617 [Leucoagaricus sp. SymC.cos]|nr:hypothetical protein AN958_04617 [Leucoagaricus sp. SymC.cos]
MSLRVSAPSLANVSPSVALEKGVYYRTRSSHKRTASSINSPNPYISRSLPPRNQQNTKLVALLLLLVLACVTCFGIAYFLFKTRWATPTQSFTRAQHANMPTPKVNASILANLEPLQGEARALHPKERFLAYLPHSGFHNQRIALENALVLARLLNRTLIVPPVRLGNKPIPYYPFDRLSHQLTLADKTDLGYCTRVPFKISAPPECLDYFDYTYVPWDWLVNLTSVKAKQKLHPRFNFDSNWVYTTLGISEEHIWYLRDQTPYQFRFVDSPRRVDENSLYSEDIHLDFLAEQTQKLLFFGTLFGSSRLRLREKTHQAVRKEIREAMTIMNPILNSISESIYRALGRAYLAIHLRADEPKFRNDGESNARTLWWTLLYRFLNLTTDDTIRLEEQIQGTMTSYVATTNSTNQPPLQHFPHLLTLGLLGLKPPLLYIATDLRETQVQPLLKRFRATFPCSFDLSNFTRHLASLDHLVNKVDGVPLRSHLLPFIDALVAAKALRVVGTKGSTFSYYVEDVLWRRIHKLPIKQRG